MADTLSALDTGVTNGHVHHSEPLRPRGGSRVLVLITLVALGFGALLLLSDEGAPALAPPAGGESAEGASAATLKGRRRVEPERRAVVAAPRAFGVAADGRKWILRVAFTKAEASRHVPKVAWRKPASKEADASPFEGRVVRVMIERGSEQEELARDTLDRQGRARILLPQLGSLSVLARASSRLRVLPVDDDIFVAPHSVYDGGSDTHLRGAPLVGSPSRDTVNTYVVVPAYLGNLVRGRAVDTGGRAVAHAQVNVYGEAQATAPDTCTDEHGRFAFPILGGGTFSVSVQAGDGSDARLDGLRLLVGADVDLGVLRLTSDERVFSGRISYPDGSPVEGVPIRASHRFLHMHVSYRGRRRTCGTHGMDLRTRTDADGRFRFSPGLGHTGSGDRWSFSAKVLGALRLEPLGVLYQMKIGVPVDLLMRGHRVKFFVHDESGLAVASAQVLLRRVGDDGASADPKARRPKPTQSNARGRVDVFLPHGSVWIATVVADGAVQTYRTVRVPRTGNESEARIRVTSIDPASGIRVTLVGTGGTPLVPLEVEVETPEGTAVLAARFDHADALVGVGAGKYRVRLRASEFAPWAFLRRRWRPHQEEVEVVSGAVTTLTAVVAEAAHLEVTMRLASDAKDMPHHAKVFLKHEASGGSESGSVSLPTHVRYGTKVEILDRELEPGTWDVRLVADGIRQQTARVELEAGALGKVTFVVEPE